MNRSIEKFSPPAVRPRTVWIGLAVAAFVVLLVGGYGLNWTWTGFSANDHLWDWLQLLVYPAVLAALPVWFSTRHRYSLHWKVFFAALLAASVIVVIGGYAFGWTWTGFAGNKLWDWWKLLLVPFVLPAVLAWVAAHPDQVSGVTAQQQQGTANRARTVPAPAQPQEKQTPS